MRSILLTTSCAILAAGLYAQTPVKTEAKSATAEQSLSNEERNTRAYIELLRTDVRKSKAQIMGEVLQLDADQAARFWPVYKEFETELTKVGDQVTSVVRTYVENYYQMTDALADQLATKVLSIEQQRNGLKKKYFERMKGTLGALTAMRFLQVENQLERLLDLQLAAQLPVDFQ